MRVARLKLGETFVTADADALNSIMRLATSRLFPYTLDTFDREDNSVLSSCPLYAKEYTCASRSIANKLFAYLCTSARITSSVVIFLTSCACFWLLPAGLYFARYSIAASSSVSQLDAMAKLE